MSPITSVLRIRPAAPARAKMGQMSNRSSNRPELRLLGSFRKSSASALARFLTVAAPFRHGTAMRQHADRRENTR
jgi:hypothetical protein